MVSTAVRRRRRKKHRLDAKALWRQPTTPPSPRHDLVEANNNPMLQELRRLEENWPSDMPRLLDRTLAPDRRDALWEQMADDCDALRRKYAWCVPDERALGVIAAAAVDGATRGKREVVEIGAGKGYWASLLKCRGVAVKAYDAKPPAQTFCRVHRGGPADALRDDDATLFLCYPDDEAAADAEDDDDSSEQPGDGDEAESDAPPCSLQALERFKGDTIVLCGELFLAGGSLHRASAPFGRSFDSGFQVRLAELFHAVLVVDLPRWPVARDVISVWRRTAVCRLLLSPRKQQQQSEAPVRLPELRDDDEEGDDWADIPRAETLSFALAAPAFEHLLR